MQRTAEYHDAQALITQLQREKSESWTLGEVSIYAVVDVKFNDSVAVVNLISRKNGRVVCLSLTSNVFLISCPDLLFSAKRQGRPDGSPEVNSAALPASEAPASCGAQKFSHSEKSTVRGSLQNEH